MREKLDHQYPLTYRARKQEILAKGSMSLFLITMLVVFWILVRPQSLKLLIVVAAIWVLNKWGHTIKGLFRLGDTITLTSKGIQSKILGHEEFASWEEVETIRIDANYFDGVYYIINVSGGKQIKFTTLIQDHLDLHARISAKVR